MVNHGVSSSLVEKLKYEIQGFYKLSLAEKMRYKIRSGEVEGYRQTILNSKDQKVDWADRFYMIINPTHRRKPHLFLDLPSSLRCSLSLSLPLSLHMAVCRHMLRSIFKLTTIIEFKEPPLLFVNGQILITNSISYLLS